MEDSRTAFLLSPFSIPHPRFHRCASVFIGGFILLLSGCASAVSQGQSTALSGVDLVQMTDDMAMKIAGDPEVQAAIAKNGRLKVVVMPAENRMRAEVLPQGQAEAFTARLRTLLSKHATGQFLWIMNRDTFYRLRGRELEGAAPGEIDLGPAPDAIAPDYSLSAVFSSLADENAKRRSSFYLCRYELTDLRDRTVLWTDSYEVKKVAVKGFGD
ncbi:MAG: hypothetical protein ABIP55_01525 [Tepidisphaeraceae bacterium]